MCLELRYSGRLLLEISLWGATVHSLTGVAWYGVNYQLYFFSAWKCFIPNVQCHL
jgi:hypothetical protein